MPNMDIATAPLFAIHNRKHIESSQNVGCYYCLKIFPATEIKDYTDNATTALCPYCHVDSIIPDKTVQNITEAALKEMHVFWF